jgi:TonB-linked SusC/RagA family outer membrane protein
MKLPMKLILLLLLLCGKAGWAQNTTLTISGKVSSSETHKPVSHATVMEKGTGNGVSCDESGFYSIKVHPGATLVFSSGGFQEKEVRIGKNTTVDVDLDAGGKLSDVIVVGYGTQRKRDLTGSIVNVSPKDLTQAPSASFDMMLQGRVPGAQIVQTSGAPGGNVNILIRGVSSVTGGNTPLFVLDGYAIGTGGGGADLTTFGSNSYSSSGQLANSTTNRINPLSMIDPADIESIQILKDASATAIYGSRGANGVVIINTKKGAQGRVLISTDASLGVQSLAKKLKLLSPREYAQFVADGRDNAWVLAGGKADDPNSVRSTATQVRPSFRDPNSLNPVGTDWQDVIFRTAPSQNYQLSASGGNKDTRYYISGNFFNQEGILIGSNYKKFALRSNVDARLSNKVKLGSSLAGSYSYGDFARAEGHLQYRGLISAALAMDPTFPIYDSTGYPYTDFSSPTGLPVENPLVINSEFSDKRDFTTIFTNNYLEYEIAKGLVFKTTFGVNYSNRETRLWKSSKVGIATSRTGPATAAATEIKSLNYLNENTLNFKKSLDDRNDIDALAGFTVQKNTDDYMELGATNFPTDQVTYVAGGQVNAGTNFKSQWSMASWFARLNYAYAGKYLLTATIRQDGSSRFGTNHRWGTFPSFSAGYRVSEEEFMKNVRFISNLKIRASYGLSGNNLIPDYASKGLLGVRQTIRNGQVISGITPNSLANDDLTWEQSDQTNFGLDLGVLEDRITFTADVYKSIKKNLLLNVTLPSASGFSGSVQNIGKLENKGIEFAVHADVVRGRAFNWNVNANISSNANKILALNSNAVRIVNSDYQVSQVGSPISSFYLLHTTGVFQNTDEISKSPVQSPLVQPGDLKFEDVTKDGKITTADKKIMGNPWPNYIWGLDNRFSYKGFALSVSVNASHGNKVYFNGGEINLNDAGVQNQLAIVADRWRSASQPGNGSLPRAIRNDYAFTLSSSSRYLFDGSFVKIRDVNLSYAFPAALTGKWKIQSLSVFADVTNLKTFTKYPGYDPEGSIGGDNVTKSGIDYFAYPNPRTFTFGLRATL